MRRLLDTLRSQFDRVVIDAPAAVPLADVGILSPLVDGVLLVVRSGLTTKPAIHTAIGAIGSGRLVGLMLNEALPQSGTGPGAMQVFNRQVSVRGLTAFGFETLLISGSVLVAAQVHGLLDHAMASLWKIVLITALAELCFYYNDLYDLDGGAVDPRARDPGTPGGRRHGDGPRGLVPRRTIPGDRTAASFSPPSRSRSSRSRHGASPSTGSRASRPSASAS